MGGGKRAYLCEGTESIPSSHRASNDKQLVRTGGRLWMGKCGHWLGGSSRIRRIGVRSDLSLARCRTGRVGTVMCAN
jgi:hypothetical protein